MKKKAILILIVLFVAGFGAHYEDIVFFSDNSAGTDYIDASWGFYKAPSFLELKGNNDKFPVSDRFCFQGINSLLLHWRSDSGGDWGAAVASAGWKAHDLTGLDSLIFYVNSLEPIDSNLLPLIAFEDFSNNKSVKLEMGSFSGPIDEDTTSWTRLEIPLDEFKDQGGACDFSKIKTIFFFQGTADGKEHSLWLDEIKIKSRDNGPGGPPPAPENLEAEGADSRMDLVWNMNTDSNLMGYNVYRSSSRAGEYEKLNDVVHSTRLYSDFIGKNDEKHYYYVTAVNNDYLESAPSDTVSAVSFAMNEDELLTSVQKSVFRYFYDWGHPVSGLARERKGGDDDCCTTGGTGFGLMAIIVGAERGFVSREEAAERTLKILLFLKEKAERYHGVWPHWINGRDGETIPFSPKDDGGDLVETAFLIQGMLTASVYYDEDNETEKQVRELCEEFWEEVEWDWYQRSGRKDLTWHWSPNHGWDMGMSILGYNEAMIVYLLAMASPTHSIEEDSYYEGWASSSYYSNGNSYYDKKIWVGPAYGGPLFFTHYSFLALDPRLVKDKYCDYFENSRNISLIHYDYCVDNPKNQVGYDSLVWGLTASDNPWGYAAQEPYNRDNGTITPTAAISSMAYTPERSIPTLKHFYYELGPRLWGEFGFKDAFNLGENWFADSYIAIDQGPIIIMMENYRTRLLWDLFIKRDEIKTMLDNAGLLPTSCNEKGKKDHVKQRCSVFPNPCGDGARISLRCDEETYADIDLYSILGRKVKRLVDRYPVHRGNNEIDLTLSRFAAGLYFLKIDLKETCFVKKIVRVK